jgi:DNA ligase (NAD+)
MPLHTEVVRETTGIGRRDGRAALLRRVRLPVPEAGALAPLRVPRAFDIEGLGEKQLTALRRTAAGFTAPADIFRCMRSGVELLETERFGETSVTNLLDGIEARRPIPLDRSSMASASATSARPPRWSWRAATGPGGAFLEADGQGGARDPGGDRGTRRHGSRSAAR